MWQGLLTCHASLRRGLETPAEQRRGLETRAEQIPTGSGRPSVVARSPDLPREPSTGVEPTEQHLETRADAHLETRAEQHLETRAEQQLISVSTRVILCQFTTTSCV